MTLNADDLMTLMMRRRSFKPAMLKLDPVEPALIQRILEAANWAPSHGQTEPWRFTVFAGEARRPLGDAFSAAYRVESEKAGKFTEEAFVAQRDKVWNAPVWISIGMMPGLRADGSRAMPDEEEVQAVACAMQNFHLMTAALGLGGQWTSNNIATHATVAKLAGLESPGRLLGFFFLGWPSVAWPEGKRRPLADKIRWAS